MKEKLQCKHGPELWKALNNLGAMEQEDGNLSAAKKTFRHALHLRENVPGAQLSFPLIVNNIGTIYLKQACFNQAPIILEGALALYQSTAVQHPLELLPTLNNLAELEAN